MDVEMDLRPPNPRLWIKASDWLLESLKIDPNDLRILDGPATAHLDAEYSNHSDSPYLTDYL